MQLFKIKKKIFCIILFLTLMMSTSFNSFSAVVMSRNNTTGNNGTAVDITNGFNRFALAGDSYAGYFKRFEGDREIKFNEYALAGSTIWQNKDRLNEAMKSIFPIVVLSIGVNDCEQETELDKFTLELESIIKQGYFNNKIIILHTYMNYDAYLMKPTKYPPASYDKILKLEADMNDHVYYVNMHDYEQTKFQQEDFLHYNKTFYDALYDRVIAKINEINTIQQLKNNQNTEVKLFSE